MYLYMEDTILTGTDNLTVTVKSDFYEEILSCYNSLGWECVEAKENAQNGAETDLTLRRPHVIPYRNERQLLQVYLENSINGMAKLFAQPCPKTTAFAVIIGLCCLALMGLGLTAIFLYAETMFVYGIVIAVLGALFLIPYSFVVNALFKSERAKTAKSISEYQRVIDGVREAGKRLNND